MPDEFYYSPSPTSESRPVQVTVSYGGEDYIFTTDAGVFSRDGLDTGSELLLDSLPMLAAGQTGLDLGCGWGPVGVLWAKRCPEAHFTMTDINERAAGLARQNAAANNVSNTTVVSGDAFEAVEGSFDAIALNPPIRTGKENIYRMFRDSMAHLKDGGALYIVIRVKQGADSAKKMLKKEYGSCETINRHAGFHVLMCKKEVGQSL